VGYGVELAHLLDLHARHGLEIFAQTDLGQRCHRNRSNEELGRMAYALLQVVERRLEAPGRQASLTCGELPQYVRSSGTFRREMFAINEQERPPMWAITAYQDRHGQASSPPVGRPLPESAQAGCPAFSRGRD
jgi:glucosyl-3-phosphoglycerate synthase